MSTKEMRIPMARKRRYKTCWRSLALGVWRTEARTWSFGVEGSWKLGLLQRKQTARVLKSFGPFGPRNFGLFCKWARVLVIRSCNWDWVLGCRVFGSRFVNYVVFYCLFILLLLFILGF
ncbi:hypothetical protein F383_21983 [Gossypium arboreum]|uniref:Transmembrane protein n=1 Tax=Gossypium arboreum TaxID=29729 RepID=A0A0B0NTE3_GOSAR|nr:hypothetical protein F383_21983 [Gossypium arboreum]